MGYANSYGNNLCCTYLLINKARLSREQIRIFIQTIGLRLNNLSLAIDNVLWSKWENCHILSNVLKIIVQLTNDRGPKRSYGFKISYATQDTNCYILFYVCRAYIERILNMSYRTIQACLFKYMLKNTEWKIKKIYSFGVFKNKTHSNNQTSPVLFI